ncbi:hypothetical protein D3C79_697460 [compost metagenome]
MQNARNVGRTGEHHATYAGIIDQEGADGFTLARQQLQDALRNTSLQQNTHRLGGDQRRLFCRFCQHAVTRGKGGGNLAGEDGQREVPWADTDYRT